MSRYTLNQAQRSVIASSLVSLGTGAIALGMGADTESSAKIAGVALGASLAWYGASIGPKRRRKTSFASAVSNSTLTSAVRIIFPRKRQPEQLPAEITQVLSGVASGWLGGNFSHNRRIPVTTFGRWLQAVERYEAQGGRGTGLSRRRWVEGHHWAKKGLTGPVWWRPNYYDTCMHLLSGTSHIMKVDLYHDAGYQQLRLSHSADVTFALVYVADRGLSWDDVPSRVTSSLSGGGMWRTAVAGMPPLSE